MNRLRQTELAKHANFRTDLIHTIRLRNFNFYGESMHKPGFSFHPIFFFLSYSNREFYSLEGTFHFFYLLK